MSLVSLIRRNLNKPRKKLLADLRHLAHRFVILIVVRPLGFPLGLVSLGLLFLLEPLVKLRFSQLPCLRIGHLALNVETFCRRKKLGLLSLEGVKQVIFTETAKVANRPLLEMWKRILPISENPLWRLWFYFCGWMIQKSRFYLDLPMHSNEYEIYQAAPKCLEFSPEEEQRGKAFLTSLGMNPDQDWFVCVYARDQGYLQAWFPGGDWQYHNFRNSKIESLTPAVQFLLDQGAWVLRMGTHVQGSLGIEHPRLVDYAQRHRDEFLDIYLTAHCKFFLGTQAGIMDVAKIFDVPSLVVDSAPLSNIPWGKDCLMIPKRMVTLEQKAEVPYAQIIRENLDKEYNGVKVNRAGYDYVDNSPEEMLEATKEMLARLRGQHQPSDQEKALLEDYFSLFPPENPSSKVKTPVAGHFLRQHPQLFKP